MRGKSLIIATAAAVVLGGAGLVLAGGFGGGHGHGAGMFGHRGTGGMLGRMARVLHRLDLSAEQRDKVHAILDAARPQFQAHVEALRTSRQQLSDLSPAKFDEAAVRTIAESQAKEMADMIVLSQKVRAQVYALLTPEQQSKLAEMRQKMQQLRQCRESVLGTGDAE
ncbi:MAG: Spy/CpxP family protein refolding chaperone [Acidobacteria bacterium]|jgi:protein CpxP|nr:Spy/CpxP family protein refolding chaperone [Acidobacteriota bacterium]